MEHYDYNNAAMVDNGDQDSMDARDDCYTSAMVDTTPLVRADDNFSLFDLLRDRAEREQNDQITRAAITHAMNTVGVNTSASAVSAASAADKRRAHAQLTSSEAAARYRTAQEATRDDGTACAIARDDDDDTVHDVLYCCAHCKRDITDPYDPQSMLSEELYYFLDTTLQPFDALAKKGIDPPKDASNVFCSADCFLAVWKPRAGFLPIVMHIEQTVMKMRAKASAEVEAAVATTVPTIQHEMTP
jgi:hypothetical protein